jgi:hypothetical protein
LAGVGLALLVVLASGAVHFTDLPAGWRGARPVAVDESPEESAAASNRDVIFPKDLAIHPDHVYRSLLSTHSGVSDMRTLEFVRQFHDLLSLYALRQSTDDNYTMRVIDTRSGGLLELYTLDSLRDALDADRLDWPEVDRIRRKVTGDLVDAHEAAGVPRQDISVKWGRRNQVLEARALETPFIEHEINFARLLNLSLLTTEIGTVETFNLDRVVSRVGARSRYQMMPSTLNSLGVEHYTLRGATGEHVQVREEWHPLIAMEAAFIVARAYSNSAGHEIPGLSSYHTGPYNVFRLYRQYLVADSSLFNANSHVVRAYQWGLTAGFDRVADKTSFGVQSRGYLPSLYGALRATESIPIDTTLTQLVERVQLRDGEEILLSALLDSLELRAPDLDWRTPDVDSSSYLRFRRINPHINLPPFDRLGVPVEANIRFVAKSGRVPVRFFLPRGSVAKLGAAGFSPFDASATQTYDHTSLELHPEEITATDVVYQILVDDIGSFGFTLENREKLARIVDALNLEYEANPTYYRWLTLQVAEVHQWVWRSRNFDELAAQVEAARGRSTMRVMPPAPLPERIDGKPLRTLPPS